MKWFKNILCVIDPEKTPSTTLARAVRLAENNQADLTVVDVAERVVPVTGMAEGDAIFADLPQALVEEHAQGLAALVEPYRKRVAIRSKVLTGTPFLEIIREVLRGKHDLVIKIPEQQNWLRRLLGSDDMHLLRKCPCPVWLIRPGEPSNYQRIMAAVDVDDTHPPAELATRHALNRQTLELALSLALSDFAELHVVHVWNAIGEGTMRGAFMRKPEDEIVAYVEQVGRHHADRLDALMREVTGQLGADALNYLKPHVHLVKGDARTGIPELAMHLAVDLIVMGTVARTGIPGFVMGNTAETILNQIECSVLAVKPPGFITPVTLEA